MFNINFFMKYKIQILFLISFAAVSCNYDYNKVELWLGLNVDTDIEEYEISVTTEQNIEKLDKLISHFEKDYGQTKKLLTNNLSDITFDKIDENDPSLIKNINSTKLDPNIYYWDDISIAGKTNLKMFITVITAGTGISNEHIYKIEFFIGSEKENNLLNDKKFPKKKFVKILQNAVSNSFGKPYK